MHLSGNKDRCSEAAFSLVLTSPSPFLNHLVDNQLSDSALWRHWSVFKLLANQHCWHGIDITEDITRPLDALSPLSNFSNGFAWDSGGRGGGGVRCGTSPNWQAVFKSCSTIKSCSLR